MTHPLPVTGESRVSVRHGWADFDTYGFGHAFSVGDSLDAPQRIPHGSVRVHSTGRPYPAQSAGNRDWQAPRLTPGVGHDGPESASTVTHWGA